MFKLFTPGRSSLEVQYLEKNPAVTDNLVGQAVTLTAWGLATPAVAASTAVAICVQDINGKIGVVANEDAVFTGTWDAVFAKTNRNTEVDLVINSWVQEIDLWASTTDVFKILATENAGTVWSDKLIKFRINKTLAL